MSEELKPGDVVEATCVITDRDGFGEIYIHAVPGTLGVVLEDDFNPEFPVIQWTPKGHGVCNAPSDTFKRYTGRVFQVVE